jgi:putative transposase
MVDDPAHYRWSSYRANALDAADTRVTAADTRVTPHPAYLALGAAAAERQTAYRALFRAQPDAEASADLRLALDQNQPLGDARFLAQIAPALGGRRQARPRGRPVAVAAVAAAPAGQRELGL